MLTISNYVRQSGPSVAEMVNPSTRSSRLVLPLEEILMREYCIPPLATALLVVTIVSSCGAPPQTERAGTSVPLPDIRPDTCSDDGRRATRDSDNVHTEDELFPDPRLRTWNRLWSLRNWIRRFVGANGHLPERLEQFVPPGPGGVDLEHDGWGFDIRYRRISNEAYELRSAGPDGSYGTMDDMVATADSLPPRPDPS